MKAIAAIRPVNNLDIIVLLDYYTDRLHESLKFNPEGADFYARHAARWGQLAIELGFAR